MSTYERLRIATDAWTAASAAQVAEARRMAKDRDTAAALAVPVVVDGKADRS